MDRRNFLTGAGALAVSSHLGKRLGEEKLGGGNGSCRVAAYYFGNYHQDKRNVEAHGPAWTEWNLVRAATPRFPAHRQPRIPLWGYEDESDPKVFEKKIAVASRSKIDAFIFDWYWYKDGSFLESALTDGYLRASNCKDLKFGVMWANHDWFDIHPAKLAGRPTLQFEGAIGREPFEAMVDRLLQLFQNPSYLLIDGCPYFSIYELYRFVQGFGGVAQAALALEKMREKARALGFPNIHVNAVTWGVQLLPGQSEVSNLAELLDRLHGQGAGAFAGAVSAHAVGDQEQMAAILALLLLGLRHTRTLDAQRLGQLSHEELAARRAQWQPPEPKFERGYGALYSEQVTQADQGCDFEFLSRPGRNPEPDPQ